MNLVNRYEELKEEGVLGLDRLRQINSEFDKSYAEDEAGLHVLAQAIYRKKKKYFESIAEEKGTKASNIKEVWDKSKTHSVKIVNDEFFAGKSVDEIKQEVFAGVEGYSPKYTKIERDNIVDGHLLVIDPADIHIGKLAMLDETSDEYSIDIAIERCIEGVAGIVRKSQGFNIEKILFVIGNDIIHIDHPHRKTTGNTPQDTDGQWWSMFQAGKKLYIEILERLVMIADVEVVFNPSNHDYTAGYFLSDSIASWFRECKQISFDVGIKHRKYFKYGKNLIGTTHGDGAKEQDLVFLMANEQPQMWADTVYRHWYLHHIHHKKAIKYQSGKDYIGCTLEYLRSPSASDSWHYKNGYVGAKKAIEGFIHHPEQGQVSRISHYF